MSGAKFDYLLAAGAAGGFTAQAIADFESQLIIAGLALSLVLLALRIAVTLTELCIKRRDLKKMKE